MKTLTERLEENYLLGCIKYKNKYNFYLMPIAWWILNYEKYSPSIMGNVERRTNFRGGVLIVTNNNIPLFIKSIEEDKIDKNELKEIIDDIQAKYPDENYSYLNFLIDLDRKEYINGFYDIQMEDYLPDSEWIGKYDEPLKYLPEELHTFWKKF